MENWDGVDPELFRLWPKTNVYQTDEALMDEVRDIPLEIKSAEQSDMAEDLRRLLNEMTVEMRQQFRAFRDMRENAQTTLGLDDDAAAKLARADIKAATDAMSQIIRTLEKLDSLQRQLAADRELAAEKAADEGGYEEAKARLAKHIEVQANDKALKLLRDWKQGLAPPDREEPADDQACQRENTARSGEGLGGAQSIHVGNRRASPQGHNDRV